MKKRIFANMFLLPVLSSIVLSIALCMVFYRQLSNTVQMEVRARAYMLKDTVALEEYNTLHIVDMRLTIIAENGNVLYDDDENITLLPNHADREEVIEALSYGFGESIRYSDTLGQETYYYAIRLQNGTIMRLAKTTSSVWGLFGSTLPVVFVVVAITTIGCYWLAGKLTARVIAPLNEMEINEEKELIIPYDELSPFAKAIYAQRERIGQQMKDLQGRSDTIATIMDSMSEGIIIINQQGIVLSANKSVTEVFALTELTTDKNILEIFRDVELIKCVKNALSGVRSEMSFLRADRTYQAYFSPVTGNGAIILFLDVTEKISVENIRKEFSANVSHELKTPLTTILGNAEMLSENMVKESDKITFYNSIKNEATRLIALIEDIIMLSQLDEEATGLTIEEVDVLVVAQEVEGVLSQKAEENKIAMRIEGAGVVNANRAQIFELIYNLMDNALKYNKPSGKVEVKVSKAENRIKIEVEDNGIGIPESEQDRVFERFYRIDKSRSKKTGGTGLGLAIVKHIVMAYSGSIELFSEENIGTKIVVTLKDLII
jgi:Signal transduction histidine kinase